MSYWEALKSTPTKKPSYFTPTKQFEMLDKATLKTDSWTGLRVVGSLFGIKDVVVPILKNGRFAKQAKNTEKFLCLPKQCLSYDFYSGTVDSEKCPYLKYVTLNSPALKLAFLNLIDDDTTLRIQDKMNFKILIQRHPLARIVYLANDNDINRNFKNSLFNAAEAGDGIARKCFEALEPARKFLEASQYRELISTLKKLAVPNAGLTYFANVFCPVKIRALNPDSRKKYTNMDLRSETEKTERRDVSGNPYYFITKTEDSEDKSYLTPIRVMKITKKQVDEISSFCGLNTVEENGIMQPKYVEDPEYGFILNVMLEPAKTAQFSESYKFIKGDRLPLNAEEKQYLIWDLTKAHHVEPYAEALQWLDDMGYLKKETDLFQPPAAQAILDPVQQVNDEIPYDSFKAPGGEVLSEPAPEISTPWGDDAKSVSAGDLTEDELF